MNDANIVHLEGSVHQVQGFSDCWTRWKPGGRGQVRFWLGVSRELAGEGFDVLLCAIEPRSIEEVHTYEAELKGGRLVKLTASARAGGNASDLTQLAAALRGEICPVIFVAEECGFDGAIPVNAHRLPKKLHLHGKAAAAGDNEGAELQLGMGR